MTLPIYRLNKITVLQLTNLKIRDEMEANDRKYVVDLDKQMEDMKDLVHLNKLGSDSKDEQIEALREELIRRDLEVESMKISIDDSAQFLLKCMQDVKEKVVNIVPQNEPGQDSEITVLPGVRDTPNSV